MAIQHEHPVLAARSSSTAFSPLTESPENKIKNIPILFFYKSSCI